MDKVDWSKSPSDAEACIDGRFAKWIGSTEFCWIEDCWGEPSPNWSLRQYQSNHRKFNIEMRPDNWKEGEKRMEQIAQNGNCGEVYNEPDNVNNPEHYQSDNGVECIDAIRAALGKEGFIAYCRGNAIKYNWRSGSKANHAEDLKKGAWYSNRAAEELENDK